MRCREKIQFDRELREKLINFRPSKQQSPAVVAFQNQALKRTLTRGCTSSEASASTLNGVQLKLRSFRLDISAGIYQNCCVKFLKFSMSAAAFDGKMIDGDWICSDPE